MTSSLTDVDALRRSVTDPATFTVVYERHMPAVFAYLRRRVGHEGAEDLTAEVFVRAFRARSDYVVKHDTALPWLFGIAANVVGNHRRVERRRLVTLERIARRVADDEPAREVPGLGPDFIRALRRLPAADREALLLVCWGELSYDEAATSLGVPIGTVRSRIARARRRLSAIPAISRSVCSPRASSNGEAHA